MWNKFFTLLMIVMVVSCMQNLNSNSNDDSFVAQPAFDSTPEGQRYSAAMAVVQNKCISCHGAWSAYTTEAAWIASALVVKNNSLVSPLYNRNKGSGGGGTKNMPPVGNLSTDELNALASWIDEML